MAKTSLIVEIGSFETLPVVDVDGEKHFGIADIADVPGSFELGMFDVRERGSAPLLHIIELLEFLYGVMFERDEPSTLTINMEPVLYGWRRGGGVLVTNFRTKEPEFKGARNFVGELSESDVGALMQATIEQLLKLLPDNPYLFAYIISRSYKTRRG
jgi:hypothetical protein